MPQDGQISSDAESLENQAGSSSTSSRHAGHGNRRTAAAASAIKAAPVSARWGC